jgi:hypothetical protein
MYTRYTDGENTGAPMVPNMNDDVMTDGGQDREALTEIGIVREDD